MVFRILLTLQGNAATFQRKSRLQSVQLIKIHVVLLPRLLLKSWLVQVHAH